MDCAWNSLAYKVAGAAASSKVPLPVWFSLGAEIGILRGLVAAVHGQRDFKFFFAAAVIGRDKSDAKNDQGMQADRKGDGEDESVGLPGPLGMLHGGT